MKTVNIGNKWFQPKVQTVGSIHDFLVPSPVVIEKTGLQEILTMTSVSGMLTSVLFSASPASAASSITTKVIAAFNPIIDIMQGLAYPIGFIMLSAGALVIMTGNRQKGMSMIKWAAIGYLVMCLAPGIMQILVEVGRQIIIK